MKRTSLTNLAMIWGETKASGEYTNSIVLRMSLTDDDGNWTASQIVAEAPFDTSLTNLRTFWFGRILYFLN